MKLASPLALALFWHSVSAAWVTPKHTLNTASGWKAEGFASGLTTPRGLIFDSAGNLLAVQQGVGIVGFTLNADGSAKSQKTVLNYTFLNHGIAFSADGKTIFASSSNTAWKWDYSASTMTMSNQKKVVTGMDNADHVTRTLLVSTKSPNLLLVARGSNDNLDLGSVNATAARAQVRVFDWTTLPAGDVGYDYNTQGKILAYGVRNEVGLVEDRAGNVWGVENSADNLVRVRQGVTTDVHQGESLLGAASAASSKYYGYPYCFSVWDPSLFPSSDSFSTGDWFVQSPNAGGIDGNWCDSTSGAVKPKMLFQPHSAPLDIKLGPGSDTNAYVSFHGSWNRSPPTGFKVVLVPGTRTSSGAWSQSGSLTGGKAGYTDLLFNTDVTACPDACFRPVGLVWNPAGTVLYVASDGTGEIFALSRT
ncbi:Soluble quino protein glucose dehydrogenase [Mycena kentingensis (nom. inval.)]|nr:Soluble quino protein glucose dehydrogenase [Mycena kentingensis (nom. inval.)]